MEIISIIESLSSLIITSDNHLFFLNSTAALSLMMTMDPEAIYDTFLVNLEKSIPKVNLELALKILLYERKMRDVHPAVELDIHCKSGTDREKMLNILRNRYGFLMSLHGNNEIFVKGNMNLTILKQISDDPEVEAITGAVTIASY